MRSVMNFSIRAIFTFVKHNWDCNAASGPGQLAVIDETIYLSTYLY